MLFDDAVSTALSRALDGTALRQRVSADNIANVMTPGFQARRVDFEQALSSAMRAGRPSTAEATVRTTADASREDGNNVQLEDETASLMQSGLQYQAVAQAVTFKHNLLKSALRG